MMPNDLPPWPLVYQQTQRWFKSGCFEVIVHDLHILLRLNAGRNPDPTEGICDSRTLQSTPVQRMQIARALLLAHRLSLYPGLIGGSKLTGSGTSDASRNSTPYRHDPVPANRTG
jgi:hypothetical protein